jgi:hypothetical protein
LYNSGFHGTEFPWQQAVYQVGSGSEDFADSFLGWTYNRWELDDSGVLSPAAVARSSFMTVNMSEWLSQTVP